MNLFSIFARIGLDDKDFTKGMEGATKQADKLAKKEIPALGSSLDKNLNSILKKSGLALAAFGGASVKVGSDAMETEQKFAAVFGDMTEETQKFVDSFSKEFGRYDADVQNMMATTQTVGKNYGLTSERALQLSKDMSILTADVGAFNDMSDTDVHERLMAAMRGEGEAAEILGLSINQTTLQEYARRQGIDESISKMTQAELMELRYGLIIEQTADMQGYATKESESFASQVRNLTSEVKEISEQVGRILIPFLTDLIGWVVDNTKEIGLFASMVAGTVLALKGMTIISTINGLWAAYKTGVLGAKLAQLGLNTAMWANPIMWIVGLIGALVSGFIYLWNTNEDFRNFWIEAWESIKQAFEIAWNSIIAFFTETIPQAFTSAKSFFTEDVPNWFKDSMAKTTSFFTNGWNGIINFLSSIPSRMGEWLNKALNTVARWGQDTYNKASEWMSKTVDGIVNWFKDLPSKFLTIGENMIQGLWQGIINSKDWLFNKVGNFFGGLVKGVKSVLKIFSPSHVFEDEIGVMMARGVGVGFEKEIPDVNNAITRSINTDIDVNKGINAQGNGTGLMAEMIGYLKIIAAKDTNIDIDGRQLKRALAPYQEEDVIYNNRSANLSY